MAIGSWQNFMQLGVLTVSVCIRWVKQFKKMMEGILEVVEVDVDQENALAEFYTIESTPTFILMRKGEQLWRQSGELSLERLERAVKEFKS